MKFFPIRATNLYFIVFLILIRTFSVKTIENIEILKLKSPNNINATMSDIPERLEKSEHSNSLKKFAKLKLSDQSIEKSNSNSTLSKSHTNHKLRNPNKEKYLTYFFSDISSTKRSLTFTISRSIECTVLIWDKVTFKRTKSNSNFLEHVILHNNSQFIEVISVTSDEIKTLEYTYKSKMNLFLVYIDPIDQNIENFSILFQYQAKNLIKSIGDPATETNQDRQMFLYPGDNQNNSTNISRDSSSVYNLFVWKVYNKNFNEEQIEFKLIFDLGRDFAKYTIFSRNQQINFNKKVSPEKDKTLVEYDWKGEINFYSALVIDISFPMYFENCKYENLNLFSIIFGSVFIIVLTLMIYFVLASIIRGEF